MSDRGLFVIPGTENDRKLESDVGLMRGKHFARGGGS